MVAVAARWAGASSPQVGNTRFKVESWLYPPRAENAPCPTLAAGFMVPRNGGAPSRVTIVISTVIALIAAATARRAARSKGIRGSFRR